MRMFAVIPFVKLRNDTSLPQPETNKQKTGLRRAQTRLLKVYLGGSVTNLISTLCVLIRILSHTNAKKKTKRLKDSNFSLLLVVPKRLHGSERVKQQLNGERKGDEK